MNRSRADQCVSPSAATSREGTNEREPTVCLTYDFDAVSAWLWTYDLSGGHKAGVYGAEVGVPRLLDLHERHDVPGTWFVPGHTVDSFPDACRSIHEGGHEIQHHGWSHARRSSFENRAEEREDMERGIESIERLTGERPTGFRAPAGGFSEYTVEILEELDFEWTASDKERDFEPYYLRRAPRMSTDGPYEPGEETDIVNVPHQWQRDDLLQMGPIISDPYGNAGTRGYLAPDPETFGRFREEFDWMYEHVKDGVFVLLIHPQCSGRGNAIRHYENLIEHMKGKPGVEFAEVSEVVDRFKEGRYR